MHAAAAACDDAVVPWLHLISPVRRYFLVSTLIWSRASITPTKHRPA